LALARLARLDGRVVEVWALEPAPRWKGDAAHQASLWEGLGGAYRHAVEPAAAVAGFHGWVVDGLFGLGARLPLAGPARAWVAALAAAAGPGAPFRILALDLPSGLDPGSPDLAEPVVPADRTACFGLFKVCHGLRPARDRCGAITRIPIPLRLAPQAGLQLLEASDLSGPVQPWDSHKRDFGHVGIRAGTVGMGGAAVLAALGALRAGAGLVTVLPDPEVRAEVAAQVPEAMVRAWDGQVPPGIDVLLAGPGGVTAVPGWDGPLVLDASALAAGCGPRWLARPGTVITPHPGEFLRLFQVEPGQSTAQRLARAGGVATGPGVLVLKGAQSIVAGGGDPGLWVNPTGHGGLSTGGSGDFLAGMVAARVARALRLAGPDPLALKRAAAGAVWLHGAAADRLGPGPLMIRELGPSLAALLRELNRDAYPS
jgi:NAD(P)H-hydrate epimerase